MVRATLLRALVLSAAVFAGALTPVGCFGGDANPPPGKPIPDPTPELLSLFQQKNMARHSPIVLRIS